MDSRLIPDSFGEFITLRDQTGIPIILGSGGFGTTIRVNRPRAIGDKDFGRDFALKILHQRVIEDRKRRDQFLAEIKALEALDHQNVVKYEDCGEKDGLIYLVMQLCSGGDLERFVTELGAFSERTALQVILQVCDGLREAHRKHYLHRDLKPRNILLLESVPPDAGIEWFEDSVEDARLCFKVVDFGLAGRLGQDLKTSGFAGSPMFCSPEQVRERDLDLRSDIYSLGMTLWYLVAGRGPLLRADGRPVGDSREAMMAHTSPEEHDSKFPEGLSPEFCELLARMVRKAPEGRFGSAHDLGQAIRRVLDSSPAARDLTSSTRRKVTDRDETPLWELPGYGKGDCVDLYPERTDSGRRAVGKFYRAIPRDSTDPVGLTVWDSDASPDAIKERQLARHLQVIKSVTFSPQAPWSLTVMSDVHRTAGGWCVEEEWHDGVPLSQLVASRGRSLSLDEIARVLMPVAEAGDFLLQNKIENAPLTLGEIRLCGPLPASNDRTWISLPVERWPESEWYVQVSGLSVPPELAVTVDHSPAGGTISNSLLIDPDSTLGIGKAFCRLFYRMAEGSEVAAAADWDEYSYTEANRLSAGSNVLLRRVICGADVPKSVGDLLRRICANEGVYRLPAASIGSSRVKRTATARTTHIPGEGDPAPEVSAPVPASLRPADPPPMPQPAPGQQAIDTIPLSRVQPIGESPRVASDFEGQTIRVPRPEPAAERSVDGTVARPKIASLTISIEMEVAQIVPGKKGTVRSPFGNRLEQRVSGLYWRGDAKVYCKETDRLFKLPRFLPPLDALLIEGRFDAVLSPYLELPVEVPVPAGKWLPDTEITCGATGLPLQMPADLPRPVGIVDPNRPGFVISPFNGAQEFPVMPEDWLGGKQLTGSPSGPAFVLPLRLPPLYAIPTQTPGCFTSPYAEGQPFSVQPDECVGGIALSCPATGKALAVPPTFPANWKFEGKVRQGRTPEAQSPFVAVTESDFWQMLTAVQWAPGAVIRCARTQRDFVLPGTLPVLAVQVGIVPPEILSPFSPNAAIAVPMEAWQPGAEVTMTFPGGAPCRVSLPSGELPPAAAVPAASAGVFTSPYAPEEKFSLRPWDLIPGANFACPFTGRPLVLPQKLPPDWRWEAEIRQGRVPEARSPFVHEDDAAWHPLGVMDWSPGQAIRCRTSGRAFHLPATLPALRVEKGPTPLSVLSPFSPHEPMPVPEDLWQRGNEVVIRLVSGRSCSVILPDSILPTGRRAKLSAWAGIPLGLDPQLRARRGAIRSPHGRKPWVEVPAKDWLPGVKLMCPSTRKFFWLPEELPPLEPRLGARPGTVWSPYTDRSMDVPPEKWVPGGELHCVETEGRFLLPAELPLLLGRVDETRPGFVESPYAPDEPVPVPAGKWLPSTVLTCAKSGREFALPVELPEWIVDVEVEGPGQVRSPYGSHFLIKVPGEDWEEGSLITCGQTNRRARLPDGLPPMEATAIDGKPGSVLSPYSTAPIEQKISRCDWHPGGIVNCSITRRPMRLPEVLAPLPKAPTPVLTLVAAVVLVGAVGILTYFFFPRKETFQSLLPVVAGNEIATGPGPAPAPTSVPIPALAPAPPVAEPVWPGTVVLVRGINAWPDSTFLEVPGAQVREKLDAETKGVKVLIDLSKLLRDPRFSKAKEMQLSFEKSGYNAMSIPLKRTMEGEAAVETEVEMARAKGRVNVVASGKAWPFYAALRFTPTNDRDNKREFQLPIAAPLELNTGTYRVEMIAGNAGNLGVEVQPWPLGDVPVSATETVLNLPPFDVAQGFAGYVRITWKKSPLQFFRPSGDDQPINEKRNIDFETWSPIVVRFDPSFTSGQFYEAHNATNSIIVFGLDELITLTDHNRSLVNTHTSEVLAALHLPQPPTVEFVRGSPVKMLASAKALATFDDSAKSNPVRNGARAYYQYCSELFKAVATPQWNNLVGGCFGSGSISVGDLESLTSKPTNGNAGFGYLVRSNFKVTKCSSKSISLSMKRQALDLSTYRQEQTEDWEPDLLSPPAGSASPQWLLSGKFRGDACEVLLHPATIQ